MRVYHRVLGRTVSFLLVVLVLIALLPHGAAATEAPPSSINPAATYLQTNGPASPIGQGDWYTSSTNGIAPGYHYYDITVPCSWPSTAPVYVDLFSPEMVTDSLIDEMRPGGPPNVIGNANNTVFELYGPGTTVTLPNLPAPTVAAITYTPLATGEAWRRFASLTAPVACGTYVLRAQTHGDDENGWRVRVGTDDDTDPTNPPPTNYDNPDGVPGTDDEILIGVRAGSYQDNAPSGVDCLTLYEYVTPGHVSVTFHNFDMDNNGQPWYAGRVRYYAPSVAYDPLNPAAGGIIGTASYSAGTFVNPPNQGWNNGGTDTLRVGDTVSNPAGLESGWWKIVTCVPKDNQYIQEGQTDASAYYQQPPIPAMTVAKGDGLTLAAPGDLLTYTINYTNTSDVSANPGSANHVVIKDTIPTNTTYVSCSIPVADGTCSQAGGVVTYTLSHHVVPGASGSVQVTVQVKPTVIGGESVVNNLTLDYNDGLGNPYPQKVASDTDTVQLIPVMVVTKTDGTLLTTPNANLTYTITYTNTASGPSAGSATNVVLRDTIPTNTTYVNCAVVSPATGTCALDPATGIVTFTPSGSVAPGASGQVTVTVQVNTGLASGTVVANNVTLDYQDDHGHARPQVSANDTDTVQLIPVMVVAKTDGTLLTTPNANLTYTITYTNTASGPGAGSATNVVLRDTIPTNTTYVNCAVVSPATGTCTLAPATGIVTFTPSGSVAPGASGQVRVTVQVNAGATGGDVVMNAVTLDYQDSAGNAKLQQSASDTDTVQSPVMVVTKTDGTLLTTPNANLTYTITYTNTASGPGAGPATNVVLRDTIPTNTAFVNCTMVAPATGTCTLAPATGIVTFTPSGSVAPGASGQVRVTVQVNAGATGGDVVMNAVTLDYQDSAGNAKLQQSASDTDSVQSPVMVVAKTDGTLLTTPNANLTYTITYTNTASGPGAGSATNVVLRDTIPTNTTYVNCAVVSPATGTCTLAPATGIVTFTPSGSVAPGASGQVRVTVQVNAGAAGGDVVVNAVTLDYQDSAGNAKLQQSASDTDQITISVADLSLTKVVTTPTPNVGDIVTFTLTLANAGPDAATHVAVQDLLPVGLTFLTSTPGVGSYDAVGGIWTVGTLPVNTTTTLLIQARVTGIGPYTNTAQVSASDQYDPDSTPGNGDSGEDDQASVTVAAQVADLSLKKLVSTTTPNAGDVVTFTLTLANAGPDAATHVAVQDLLPAGLTFLSSTPGVGSYDAVGGIWTVGTLPVSTTTTLLIQARVTSGAAMTNRAQVSASDQYDPDSTPGNSVPSEDDQASASLNVSVADLSLTKVVDTARPNVGDVVTFTLTLANAGPDAATHVAVQDLLPVGLTFLNSTPGALSYDAVSGIWTVGTLPVSTTTTLAIQAQVTSSVAMTNTAQVSASDQYDPDSTPGNDNPREDDQASASLNVPEADLALTKAVNTSTPNLGEVVTFTLTLTNAGPDAATHVAVSEPLPLGLLFLSSTPGAGSYDATSGIWTVGTLAAHTSTPLVIRARVTSGAAMTNTAQVSAADQHDPNSTPGNGNPSEDDQASVTLTPPEADLSLTKAVNTTTPNVGDIVTFTLTLANAGPDAATHVAVSELLPVGLTFVSDTPSQGSYDAASGVWTVGTLPVSTTTTLLIHARVTGVGPYTNTAQVSASDQHDPDSTPGNGNPSEDDQASVILTPQVADLSVRKTVDNPTPNVGDVVTFTIAVANAGPSNATGVAISEPLPAGLTFVSDTPSQGSYDPATGVWMIGGIAIGNVVTLDLRVQVSGVGPYTNIAAISRSDQYDPNDKNNKDNVSIGGALADLSLSKRVNTTILPPNHIVDYTIEVVNKGPSAATGVAVAEYLPAGSTVLTPTTATGSYDVPGATWSVGHLAVGERATLTLSVQLGNNGPYINTAEISRSDQPDPNSAPSNAVPGEDDQASATVDIGIAPKSADLELTKTASTLSTLPNSAIFLITVINKGPDTATNVAVSDPLPAGLVLISTELSQGSYNLNTDIWTVGTIPSGASVTLRIITVISTNNSVTNTAQVSNSDQPDPDSTPGNSVVGEDDQASVTFSGPTAVTLTSFSATQQTKGVQLRWTTGSELNSLGFQIYRSASGSRSDAELVTPQIIVSRGGVLSGASYNFLDLDAKAGARYSYWLIEREIGGGSSEYGPVQATSLNAGPYRIFMPLVLR